MKAQEIAKYLEEIAPKSLAYEGEEFDFNRGLIWVQILPSQLGQFDIIE